MGVGGFFFCLSVGEAKLILRHPKTIIEIRYTKKVLLLWQRSLHKWLSLRHPVIYWHFSSSKLVRDPCHSISLFHKRKEWKTKSKETRISVLTHQRPWGESIYFSPYFLFLMLKLPYLTGYWPKDSTTKKEATNFNRQWILQMVGHQSTTAGEIYNKKMLNPKKKPQISNCCLRLFWHACGPFPVWTITLLGANLVLLMTFAETVSVSQCIL